MGLRNGFKWQSKPPPGTGIDRSRPLAAGLAVSLAFNEGGGEPFDAAGARTFPRSNPAAWSVTPGGLARYATAGTSAVEIPEAVVGPLITGAFSLRMVFRLRSLTSDYTTLTDSTGRQLSFFLDHSGNGNFAISSTPGFAFAAGTWYDFVVTRTAAQSVGGGHSNGYVDGAPRYDVAGIGTNPITGDLCFGRNSSGGGANADCDYSLIQVWPGLSLSAADVAALHADPYSAYLAPTTRRFFVPASGGGGGVSTSAAAAATLGAFVASAAVTPGTTASASATLGAFTPSALAVPGTTATASAALGPFTALAASSPGTSASAAVTLGAFTASASAVQGTSATASAFLGGFVAAAVASPLSAGATSAVAAATLGSFTASAGVTPGTSTSASAALGTFVSAAVVTPGTSVSAAAPVGAFTASASAVPGTSAGSTSATAAATLGSFTAVASATPGTRAVASASLGGFTAAASVTPATAAAGGARTLSPHPFGAACFGQPAGLPTWGSPAALPATFIEALRLRVKAGVPSLSEVYRRESPPIERTTPPFAILNVIHEAEPVFNILGLDYPGWCDVQFSFVARSDGPAEAARDAAFGLFTPRKNPDGSAANPAIVFQGGACPPLGSMPGMRTEARQPGMTPSAKPIWVFTFTCRFVLTRTM